MKHLIQRPLPDESICSALIRTSLKVGLPIGVITPAVAGGRKWYPSFFQCGPLEALADATRMPVAELLLLHSFFPYASAFFDAPLYERSVKIALSTGPTARSQAPVTQGVSDHCPHRRFCRQCVSNDIRRWGESYWHRSHNLPGVRICSEHLIPLVETTLRTTGSGTWRYTLPAQVAGRAIASQTISTFDVDFAVASVSALTQRAPTPPSRTHYRHALIHRGLLSSERQVNPRALAAWGLQGAGASIDKLGLRASDKNLKWMAQMVRPHAGVAVVPLKHLIFRTLISRADTSSQAILDHIPSGPSGKEIEQLDARYCKDLQDVCRKAIRGGERISVRRALEAAGCWSAYRRATAKFPKTGSALLALRRSEASVRKITA